MPYSKIYLITTIIIKEISTILFLLLSLLKIFNHLHLSNSPKWLPSKRIQSGLSNLGKTAIEETVSLWQNQWNRSEEN